MPAWSWMWHPKLAQAPRVEDRKVLPQRPKVVPPTSVLPPPLSLGTSNVPLSFESRYVISKVLLVVESGDTPPFLWFHQVQLGNVKLCLNKT